MGVVYKLTPEIVAFILQQKKLRPEVSCRQLAGIVKLNYNLTISKSSINKVLKNSRLSNPVGRPPEDSIDSEQKFKLPDHRKIHFIPEGKQDRPLLSDSKRKATSDKILPAPPAPVPVATQIIIEPERDIMGIGAIFLKAAEWSISEGPLLADFIRRQLKADSLADIDTIADILLYSSIYGIKQIDEFVQYKSKGLWLLHGLQESIGKQILYDTVNGISDSKRLALDLSLELPALFTKISYIKIILEDEEEILVDPLFVMPYKNNVQTGHYSSLNQTIQTVVEAIIENVHSAVFCSVGSQNGNQIETSNENNKYGLELSEHFLPLIWAFNQSPGRNIQKVGIFDQNEREIINFDELPNIRRTWIAGIWPWQSGFEKLIWEGKAHRLSSNYLSNELFYKNIKINELNKSFPLEGYVVLEAKDSPPVLAVLTNEVNTKAEDILNNYLKCWPHLEQGHFIHLVKTYRFFLDIGQNIKKTSSSNKTFTFDLAECDNADIFQITAKLSGLLSRYCLNRFFEPPLSEFDISHAIKSIYGLPGNIEKNAESLLVCLNLGESEFSREIEKAAKVLNESKIKDFQGRRLFMKHKK